MQTFDPARVFTPEERVMIFPARYIQGCGVLGRVGHYLQQLMHCRHVALLISNGGWERHGELLRTSLAAHDIAFSLALFGGECSLPEIETHSANLQRDVALCPSPPRPLDALVAVGGGKCVDAGKCISDRLNIPYVICPTLASNDAPCSALSVIYTPEGQTLGCEFFRHSPAAVIVDLVPILHAPPRYLIAGMGDALAAFYEAEACYTNRQARTMAGARPTLTARTLARLSMETLMSHGVDALKACESKTMNQAFEVVVESDILVSGLGFESGGLALAHAVAQGLTFVPKVYSAYLHGEMVSIGVVTQLIYEANEDEHERVAAFCASVGLPYHLGQLGLSDEEVEAKDSAVMEAIIRGTLEQDHDTANMIVPVTAENLRETLVEMHRRGKQLEEQRLGRVMYDRYHSS